MRFLLLISSFFIIFNSCSQECNCTLVACPCTELSMVVRANSISNDPQGFDPSELDSFYILLTDLNFNTLDSVKITFSPNGDGNSQDLVHYIKAQHFSNFQGFKNHNFILKNHTNSLTESLSNFDFNETMDQRLCNKCSPCDDQYVTCTSYRNLSYKRNGNSQNNFELILSNP